MSQRHVIILAGGSGTRFWPASRRLHPKQLLAVHPQDERCLMAQVVDRVEPLVPRDNIWIATGQHLLEASRKALPQLRPEAFLGEPRARNTAPCIAWATEQIHQRHPEASVAVIPSDQHIENEARFLDCLRQAFDQALAGCIATLGITPTRPETGYGYLQLAEAVGGGVHRVQRFVEKPDAETAEHYLRSGKYLWNSGIFVYRARRLLEALAAHAPELHRCVLEYRSRMSRPNADPNEAARAFFDASPAISIDYAVMEHETELRVVPCDAGWNDLGSWQAVWETLPHDARDNVAPPTAVLVDAQGNLVFQLDSSGSPAKRGTVALVGVENLCVVQRGDCVLVIPRERCQDVRAVVEALQSAGRDDLL